MTGCVVNDFQSGARSSGRRLRGLWKYLESFAVRQFSIEVEIFGVPNNFVARSQDAGIHLRAINPSRRT